jgi:hypothetical protein
MSDTPGHTAPSISPEFVSSTREVIAQIERDHADSAAHMAHATRLRQALDEAVAVTGYKDPAADSRSPAQRAHDQRFGVEPGKLPAALQGVIDHDAAREAPAKEAVAAQLDRIGVDYASAIEAAKSVFLVTGSAVKPESLSAHTLVQLRVYGEHLKKHAASRPK